jgi:hypothetical protein
VSTLLSTCPAGGEIGPCGRETHCEAQLAGEAMWDLAARDLGPDLASAWELVDRLWYQSRQGAAGPLYQCVEGGGGGCFVNSLYAALLTADDNDGNLANGTTHMPWIYAALNRHGIACPFPTPVGSGVPLAAMGVLSGTPGSGSVDLTWSYLTGVGSDTPTTTRVLRSDLGCDTAFTRIATVPVATMSFTDAGLPAGFPLSYRLQVVGTNPASEGPVSNCVTVTPGPTPRPVPRLTASRAGASSIALSWDVTTCPSPDYELLFGDLAGLPSYTLSGSLCALGTTGSAVWGGVPTGNLWFLVTGISGAGSEASWGLASSGPRHGTTPSFHCGSTVRVEGAGCP